MADGKEGLLSFNMFVALIILIPASMLLIRFFGELNRTCAQAESTVIFTLITGCVVLLSMLNFLKTLMME